MHPDDRVLVAVMNRPHDFEIARDQGWYRIPERTATPGGFFEYVAFYFTAAFGPQKWAVHYYARCLGYELVTRRDLLPDEPDHPRAGERYYKLELGPLQMRRPPIVSRRWRRIAFIHTTWDRFQVAEEINDLFTEGGEFVDRLYHALREEGLSPERCYPVREAGVAYLGLVVPCCAGLVVIEVMETGDTAAWPGTDATVAGALRFQRQAVMDDLDGCLANIRAEVKQQGGVQPCPQQASNCTNCNARASTYHEREGE